MKDKTEKDGKTIDDIPTKPFRVCLVNLWSKEFVFNGIVWSNDSWNAILEAADISGIPHSSLKFLRKSVYTGKDVLEKKDSDYDWKLDFSIKYK